MTVLSKNIFFNLMGQFSATVLGFVAVKFIFSQLGYDILGLIFFCAILNAMIMGILDKSIYALTVQKVAAAFETDKQALIVFLQTFTFLTWGIAAGFVIILWFLVPYLSSEWINLPEDTVIDIPHLMRILLSASLLAFPISFYMNILRGIQRMGITNLVEVSFSAVQQLGIIFVLMVFEGNATAVITWIATVYVMKLAAFFVICLTLIPKAALVPYFHLSALKTNSRFTRDMIFVSIFAMLFKQGDKLALSKFASVASLGLYGFAFNAISKATIVNSAIGNAAYPVLCKLGDSADKSALLRKFQSLQRLVIYANVPIFFGVIVFTKFLYVWVFDNAAAETLRLPTILLCLGLYLNCTMALPYRLILALNKTDIAVKQDFISLMFILPGVIYLTFKFGVAGASSSVLLYAIFGVIYMIPKVYSKLLFVDWRDFFYELTPPLIKGTLCFGLPFMMLVILDAGSLANSIVVYVAGLLTFGALSRVVINEVRAMI